MPASTPSPRPATPHGPRPPSQYPAPGDLAAALARGLHLPTPHPSRTSIRLYKPAPQKPQTPTPPRHATKPTPTPAPDNPPTPSRAPDGRWAPNPHRSCRDAAEQLLALAAHLNPSDRDLLFQIVNTGATIAAISRAGGRSRSSLSRRLRLIIRHLKSPAFSFAVAHAHSLPHDARRVAHLVVLQRKSLRLAASSTGLSLHQVRQHLRSIHSLASAANRRPNAKPLVPYLSAQGVK